MLVLEEREKLECMEKTPWSKGKNQQQTNPHTALTQGFEARPYWLEASALTTEQPFLLLVKVLQTN